MQTPPILASLQAPDFICPVNKKPLHGAVTLYPCACKVNLSSISGLVDTPIVNGWKMKPGFICPVTSTHSFVKKAFKDHFIRDIAKKIFKGNYPGEVSQFIHVKGEWKFDAKGGTRRKMLFVSSNPRAFIKNFEIYNDKEGSSHITFSFDKTKSKEFLQFLKDNNLIIEMSAKEIESGIYSTKNSNEFNKLHTIISTYCAFPPAYEQK